MDAMMTKTADGYENDPVVVSKMREAVHTNLYCIVNSNAMNGIGPDTVVRMQNPWPINVARNVTIVSAVLFAISLFLLIKKRKAFIKEYGKKKDIIA